jgi:uncharacterized pyridoxamine 5'-phosphate oxidase family protein
MEEVEKFLKACGHYFLATADGGQPRVRPFGTANVFEGRLYIQTGKSKDVSQQIEADPLVEICAYDGETWLRLAATAVRDDRREAKAAMLDAYPSLKSMYDPDDDNTNVLALENATATFYSFTAEPRVVTF